MILKGFCQLSLSRLLAFAAMLLFVVLAQQLGAQKVSAAYDGGRIIDNPVFLDANSMSASQVQTFLASKGGQIANRSFMLDCDAAGSQAKQSYLSLGAPCGQSIPASSIIYYSAQVYGISPKVILATLQKEQSLITATNPTDRQYAQAMGYACPTSGSCSDSSNFFWQIDNGAWVLRFHYERARGNMSWWYSSSSWVCGTQKAYYSPNLYPNQNVNFYDENGVMYRTHYITNAATSSMYCYTPHAYNNPQGLYGRAPYGTTGLYYSGSYNFVYFFDLWFGTTQVPNYNWHVLDQAFFKDSARSIFIGNHAYELTGKKVYARITVKNTGNLAWNKNSANPIRMGTLPGTVNHPLCNSSWQWCTRPALQQEALVQPGENATFLFDFTMPPVSSQAFRYTLVAEGAAWFPDYGVGFEVRALPLNIKSDIINQSLYFDSTRQNKAGEHQLTMAGGTKIYAKIVLRNTSNFAWDKSGPLAVKLAGMPRDGNHPLCNGSWLSCSRTALQQETLVQPGENATFLFDFIMPNSFLKFVYGLVVDGRAWNSDFNKEFYLNGAQPNYSWQVTDQSFFSDPGRQSLVGHHSYAPAGTKIYARITLKNTGNYVWQKGSPNPVRLGIRDPYNSPHQLCSSDWLDCIRPAEQQESLVKPNEFGTFLFSFTMPSSGFQAFKYRPVAEGRAWFPDLGAGFAVNVTN